MIRGCLKSWGTLSKAECSIESIEIHMIESEYIHDGTEETRGEIKVQEELEDIRILN